MKRFDTLASAVICALAWGTLGGPIAQGEPPLPQEKAVYKAVIHVNFDDAERQKRGLRSVANMLNEVKEGDIEVVCHSTGIGLLMKKKTTEAVEVERLMKAGVKFAACENTMREKSIAKDDLLPGVVTVPSGAVEVVRKQQEGYGYFRP